MKITHSICRNIILLFALFTYTLWAQIPNGYYNAIEGKKDKELKTALYRIISGNGFRTVGYSGLWNAYSDTDARPDGKVWDMYSNTTSFTFGTDQDKGSGGSTEGDKYNREHSFPQSWFESASGDMKSDLFNVYPTDKLVNNKRSNYPYGETNGEDYKSNNSFSKLGSCTFSGYSGTVFEPNDQYKGDFARSYFYIATCYENVFPRFGGEMTAGNSYPGYKDWAVNLLLKWHRNDNVDSKETDRNNAVQEKQHNRNPFIDYPELVEYIWGNKKGIAFSLTASANNTDISPVNIKTLKGQIIITTPEAAHIYLYDSCGNLFRTENGQGEIIIPIDRSGIYIVQIQNNTQIITHKIRL